MGLIHGEQFVQIGSGESSRVSSLASSCARVDSILFLLPLKHLLSYSSCHEEYSHVVFKKGCIIKWDRKSPVTVTGSVVAFVLYSPAEPPA